MLIRVIYQDKSAGMIEDSKLEELLPHGKIVAFQRSNRWIGINRSLIQRQGGECNHSEKGK